MDSEKLSHRSSQPKIKIPIPMEKSDKSSNLGKSVSENNQELKNFVKEEKDNWKQQN